MKNPNSLEAYNLIHRGSLALARAERAGICIDLRYIERQKRILSRKIEKLENEFFGTKFYRHWEHSMPKPNIHSNAQLSTFLYKIKKLDSFKDTDTGKGSTNEEALKQLGIPELDQLLKIRKLKKIRDTYLESFAREATDDSKLHPSFNLHLVKTFRSSCDRPNFQNIPKRDEDAMNICRRALFPRPGHQLMEVDYSQIEVRVAACYHHDPVMMNYINDPTTDMHRDMAVQLFRLNYLDKSITGHSTLRSAAKNGFVFPQFYGDYYGNCAKNLSCTWGKLPVKGKWKPGQGIPFGDGFLADHLISRGIVSLDSFTNHVKEVEMDFWGTRFKVYQRWKERWWRKYQKNGYVDLLSGFRCSGLMNRKDAINYPIQGAAFHVLLLALILIDDFLIEKGMDSRIIGQIHDAIVLDVHPDELPVLLPEIKRIMTESVKEVFTWIITPLNISADIAGVDESWADLKPFKI